VTRVLGLGPILIASNPKWSSVSPPDVSVAQKIARYALIGALVMLGAWMLRRFLPALCWAVVLAIGTSSLYDRWLAKFRGKRRYTWAALTFTTLVGIVLIVPVVYGGIVAVREAISLVQDFLLSTKDGPPDLPQWLLQLPLVGDWVHGSNMRATAVEARLSSRHGPHCMNGLAWLAFS
jgi:predicted PurR-regulated permease PerM